MLSCKCIGKSHTNVHEERVFSLSEKSNRFSLRRHKFSFSYLFPFPILSFFRSRKLFCFPFLLLGVGAVLDQYSHSSVIESSSFVCITNIYRMRGLTDFARTIPIGKKIIGNFRLVDAFFFPPLSFSQSSVRFCVRLFGPVI